MFCTEERAARLNCTVCSSRAHFGWAFLEEQTPGSFLEALEGLVDWDNVVQMFPPRGPRN